MLHGVQGGYYWKSFGKHGAAAQPATPTATSTTSRTRTSSGGHVTVGGIVYQGDAFPPQFRGKYIAADLLGHTVYWHDLEPRRLVVPLQPRRRRCSSPTTPGSPPAT